jgi:cystathionine beta-lyase family protein involved in aluminum resistance
MPHFLPFFCHRTLAACRIDEIERAVKAIKTQNPEVIVLVDNCYGEFTDVAEPPSVSLRRSFVACDQHLPAQGPI